MHEPRSARRKNGLPVVVGVWGWSLLLSLQLVGCAPTPDQSADRAELLRLHDLAREAHLSKRAGLLTAVFADTFYNIARGEVTSPSREESRVSFQAYFDRSTFQAWDDLAPPLIRISPDGRMAYVIVRKKVQLTAADSTGTAVEEHRIFAWLETYEKQASQWRLTTVTSTDRPDVLPESS